jgi:acyl carrier protein phosphodiesterase
MVYEEINLPLSEEVQKGIMLHRAIDTLLMLTPSLERAPRNFTQDTTIMLGVIVDVFYDFWQKN